MLTIYQYSLSLSEISHSKYGGCVLSAIFFNCDKIGFDMKSDPVLLEIRVDPRDP